MVSLLVVQLLPPGNAHYFAFDPQNGHAVCELDVKVVAGEGEDFFFEDECFGLSREEGGEDAYGGGDGWEGHFG